MSQPGSIHFEISERKILLRIIDVVVVLGALHVVGVVFDFDYFKINKEHWFWIIVLGGYLLFFATVFELYQLQKASRITATLRGAILTSSLTALVYILTPFFTPSLPDNRLQILFFYLSITLSLLLWRVLYIKLFSSSRFYKNILIIADATDAAKVATTLQEADPNYKIAGYINTDLKHVIKDNDPVNILSIQEAKDRLEGQEVSEIVIASSHVEGITTELYDWLLNLVENGFSVREYTQIYEEITDRIPVQYVGKDFYKYFPFARNNQNKLYKVYNRAFDIVCSVIGLLLGCCFIPFILIGNFIGNRGSLLYRQRRVGKNRKVFKIYKLRSMIKNAEAAGAQFATKNDSRVTPFGKFLRRTRMDEFPQFYNILKGEMSMIGPRPERPVFVKQLSNDIPFYNTRHVVNPGLTGWAQVKMKYGESAADSLKKLQYDLYYIKHRSIFLDLRIVVKTMSTIVFFKGQ